MRSSTHQHQPALKSAGTTMLSSAKLKALRSFINLLLLLLLTRGASGSSKSQGVSQTLEIIRARGFAGEQYQIKSYDGYPLTVYHVVNPLADQRSLNKFPVIIFHGLGGDSTQMISHSVDSKARKPLAGGQLTALRGDECLAFMLSNNNYDVWLADSRGVNLNNRDASTDTNLFKSQSFWRYSLDEQVFNDAPKTIDFVLEQTQTPKALVVTYSESSFFLFALLSAVPDYADRIASLVAMAPTAYVANLRGLAVPWMVPFMLTPESIDGNYAPQPIVDTIGMTARRLCSIQLISKVVCEQAAKAIVGNEESNGSNAADFFTTLAKSSSIRSFKHFVQLNQQRRFGMYDYGPQLNLIKYKQATAPNYDLARVKLPTIVLARGGNDFLSTVPDQEHLIQELGVKPILDIRLPKYNHLDFILNENLIQDVNLPVAQIFAHVSLGDVSFLPGTISRDPSLPLPVKIHKPDDSVEPQERLGRIINAPVHVFQNLVDAIELKSKINLMAPSKQSGRISEGIDSLVNNVDRLAGSLYKFPDFFQSQIHVSL